MLSFQCVFSSDEIVGEPPEKRQKLEAGQGYRPSERIDAEKNDADATPYKFSDEEGFSFSVDVSGSFSWSNLGKFLEQGQRDAQEVSAARNEQTLCTEDHAARNERTLRAEDPAARNERTLCTEDHAVRNERTLRALMERIKQEKLQGSRNQQIPLYYDLIDTLKNPLSVRAILDGCSFLVQHNFRELDYTPLRFHLFAAQACLAQKTPLPPGLLMALAGENFSGRVSGVYLDPRVCYSQALMDLRQMDPSQKSVYHIDALLGLGSCGFTGRLGYTDYKHTSCVFMNAYNLASDHKDQGRMFEALMGLGNTKFIGHLADKIIQRPIDAFITAYEKSMTLSPADQVRALLAIGRVQSGLETIGGEKMQTYAVHQRAVDLAVKNRLPAMHAQCLVSAGFTGVACGRNGRSFGGEKYPSRQACFVRAYEIAKGCDARAVQEGAILGLGGTRTFYDLKDLTTQTLDLLHSFMKAYQKDSWVMQYLFVWGKALNYLTRHDLSTYLHSVMADRNVFLVQEDFEDDEAYLSAHQRRNYAYLQRASGFMQGIVSQAQGQVS
ncbi:MAG: hypothetical protein C0514_06385 [Candidatus Puniceispirillum sp.]|nr:hypothetical protein [Candidatus Puniceispirillum sp.]